MTYTIDDVLYYYDTPIMWTMKDTHDTLWIAILIEDDHILMCETFKDIVESACQNKIPARSLFETNQFQYGKWTWESMEKGTFAYIHTRSEDDCDKHLPTHGVPLVFG